MRTKQTLHTLVAVACLSASQLFAGGLPGTVIGSSGSYGNGGNTIAKVFDSNLNTYFDAAHASGDWAGLDFGFGNAKVITGIRSCPRPSWAGRMVGGQFQGANVANFSSGVVTLYTITSQPPEGVFTAQAITNTTAFRYVRYLGPTNGYCNVSEVEFYDADTPVPLTLFGDFSSSGTWADPNFKNINEYYNNPQRQSGVFRQTPYTEAATTAAGGAYDSLTQLNSSNQPNSLLLATDPAHGQGFTWVSPNQDFAAFSAQGANVTDIKVSIAPLGPGSAASSDHWAALVFGAAAGSVVTNAGTGVLIRNGGAYQVFDNGTGVASGNVGASQFYNIDFQINATNGTYRLLINGLTVYSGTHTGGYLTNNYITLESRNTSSDTGVQDDYFQDLLVSGTRPKATANTSYYVSPAGNDANAGTSSATPWKTLLRANVEQFQTGDQILLQGGQTFNGFLNLSDSGAPGSPITIGSYGTGNATIKANGANAITLIDTHDITIQNLTLSGTNGSGDGICFFSTGQTPILSNFNFTGLDVEGFNNGIHFDGPGRSQNLAVTYSTLAHNGNDGIFINGDSGGDQSNTLIDHCTISGNGYIGVEFRHSDHSVVQYCVADHNGAGTGTGAGLSWIVAEYVLVQYNECYNNGGAPYGEQAAIRIDVGLYDIVQYNYTHDNPVTAIVLQTEGGDNFHYTSGAAAVRYNVSVNDDLANQGAWPSSFRMDTVTNVDEYGNTIYQDLNQKVNDWFEAAALFNGTDPSNRFFNNLVVSSVAVQLWSGASSQMFNNVFYSGDPNAPQVAFWPGAHYDTDINTFRADALSFNGGNDIGPVGKIQDPFLAQPGQDLTINNPEQLATLTGYQLQTGSPLRNAGQDLSIVQWDPYNYAADPFLGKYFSTNRVDFYGNPLPTNGSGLFSIGAHQVNPTGLPAPTGLSATTGSSGVALSWNASIGATNYDVWRATVSGGPYRFVATVNGTAYTDITTVAGVTYYYVVTAQNASGYSPNSAEVSVVGVTPVILTHRYSFNEAAGSTNIIDSVGGRNGVFHGTSGGPNGAGNLVLNGTNGYVDLGANLITGYPSFSVETWVNIPAANNWDRIFDFGNSDGNNGSHSMDLAARNGGNAMAFEIGDGNPSYQGNFGSLNGPRITGAGLTQVALVYDPAASVAKLYTNGILVASGLTGTYVPLSALQNVFSYIGKSTYAGSTLNGTVQEFRLYSGALSAQQVMADYQAGPNALANTAPVLGVISNQTIVAGQTLSLTNTATDTDIPAQTLSYSLSAAPAGASINATNGILTWRPTMAQAPGTNGITVVVTDNGVPPLSATQSFTVTVTVPMTPVLGNLVWSNGVFSLGVSGSSGPDYVLLGATNLTPPITWKPISTNAAATVPFSFTIPATNSGANFYRLQLGP